MEAQTDSRNVQVVITINDTTMTPEEVQEGIEAKIRGYSPGFILSGEDTIAVSYADA